MSQYYAPFVSRRLNKSVVIDSLAKYLQIRLVFTSFTVKILFVQEAVTHLYSILLYKMGHYFLDTQYVVFIFV